MRTIGAWAVAAALTVGLGSAAARDDKTDGGSKYVGDRAGHLTNLLFGSPPPKLNNEKKPGMDNYQASPNLSEAPAHQQQRHMNAVLRRVQVCDRLRQIAEQTGNAELQQQADELEARAWAIYQRQTESLATSAAPIDSDAHPRSTAEGMKRAARSSAAKRNGSAPHRGIEEAQDESDRMDSILMGKERP